MTVNTPLSYRKAKSGEWVVFGPAARVRVGSVEVAKKDGTLKRESVVRIGKSFTVDGIACCYGYIAPRSEDTFRRDYDQRGYCDECGERLIPGTHCWEIGGVH